jgi:DICT domain-containing protein
MADLTSLSDTDVVDLVVTINGTSVVDTKLYYKYALSAIRYALEGITVARREDANAEIAAANANIMSSAMAPINEAIELFKSTTGSVM